MILTEQDYRQYWDRNPYLIAKMLTLFVEHPVVFIGYSISDSHIQRLLGNLVDCLTEDQLSVLNGRLFFVRRAKGGPAYFGQGSITIGSHTLPIWEIVTDDYSSIYEMLGSLPRKLPTKFARAYKDSIYKLAYDSTETSMIHVLPFDDDADLSKVEMVIGIGTMSRLSKLGYGHYRRWDLIVDMLDGEEEFDGERLIARLLPELFRITRYNPLYYPLAVSRRLRSEGRLDDSVVLHSAAQYMFDHPDAICETLPPGRVEALRSSTFRDLIGQGGRIADNYGTVCRYEVDDVLILRDYIRENLGTEPTVDTQVGKLACKYDRLVYGFDYTGDRRELLSALGLDYDRWTPVD